MKHRFFLLGCLVMLTVGSARVQAATMISNLGVPFDRPEQGIGDIQAIFPEQRFGMAFVTGASTYRLDSVTFEHFEYEGPLQVQIYRFVPPEEVTFPAAPIVLHGQFSNPTMDPRPTQWPGWTSFVTYSPSTPIILEPNSWYMVAATETPQASYGVGVLFAPSSAGYSFSTGWSSVPYWPQWRSTYYGWEPHSASPYSLKLELNATPIPEPSVLVFGAASFFLLAHRKLRRAHEVQYAR